MQRATLQALAQDFAADYPLPAEDWEAIVPQAEKLLAAIDLLGELPLPTVEPPAVYAVGSGLGEAP